MNFAIAELGQPSLRLDTMARLRWLAIAGQSAALLFVAFVLNFPTPLAACAAIILAATVLNVALTLRFPGTHRFDSMTAALLLGFDILQLSALLFLTGGLQNPFALLFLAPVMISAATLEPRYTVSLGLVAMSSASLLAIFHQPLPWLDGQVLIFPGVYTVGIWVSILLGLAFIGIYAWRVAEEARQMARALAATELVLAREQHLTALDGLAAAAAHELGTPLATITVIAKEMQRQLHDGGLLEEDVTLLQQEAARCRAILGKIASLGTDDEGPLGHHNLGEMIEEVVAPHRNFGIEIEVKMSGTEPQPASSRNPGLLYGIGNIVENAVDFAVSKVRVTALWTAETVTIIIADDGPGFPPEVLQRIGEPYLTTRPATSGEKRHEGGGLGLGLFIAKTLLERSGADIRWRNNAMDGLGGAQVTLRWPLQAFTRTQQSQ